MKPIEMRNIDGNTIITIEMRRTTGVLCWKKETVETRRFKAVACIADDYWRWLELPDMRLVPDSLSFQLDAWKKHGIA